MAMAYRLLDEAYDKVHTIDEFISVLPTDHLSRYRKPSRALKERFDSLKKRTWKTILKKTQAPEFMTKKRLDKIEADLEKPDNLPVPHMLKEFVKKTFDWLQPREWTRYEYKTNQKCKYELKDKVIKSNVMRQKWSGKGFDINYSYEQNIRSMDNAFSLLDGKGVQK